jgi:hypothetical protein
MSGDTGGNGGRRLIVRAGLGSDDEEANEEGGRAVDVDGGDCCEEEGDREVSVGDEYLHSGTLVASGRSRSMPMSTGITSEGGSAELKQWMRREKQSSVLLMSGNACRHWLKNAIMLSVRGRARCSPS